jgi:hypothetical protein
MTSNYVVLAVKQSDKFSREARIIARFENGFESKISERALNDVVKSDGFRDDAKVKYCSCSQSQLDNWCASNGIYLCPESAGELHG